MNPVIPDEAREAQSVIEGLFGDSILGFYLFGSAVVGGLKRDSDVDLLVVVNHSLTLLQRKSLVTQLMNVSGAIGNPHSIRPIELTVVKASDVVPWQFPPRAEFVYGEWLREAFEAGIVPQSARDPDLAIVLKQVIDNSLPLRGCKAASLLEPVPLTHIRMAIRDSLPNLVADTAGDERNVVLTLCRMWLTVATGDIAPKDVAARWAKKHATPVHAALLEYAREGYLGRVEDAWHDKQEDFELLVWYVKRSIEACLDAD